MSEGSRSDTEAADQAHVVTRRAIRRLDLLEWVVVLGGMVLSLVGGAIVGWLLSLTFAWPFRSAWIGASLFLFVVSGGVALLQIRSEARADAARIAEVRDRHDG